MKALPTDQVGAMVGGLRSLHGAPNAKTLKRKQMRRRAKKRTKQNQTDATPDWSSKCENCGESPVVPATGMCGPCTFGEADTAGGNW